MVSILFGRGVAATGLALFPAAFARPAVLQSAWERIQSSGPLRMGYLSQPPYCSKDLKKGGWRRFMISMAERIATTLGTKWVCVETKWGTVMLDLIFKKIEFMS
jgi:hypothetical protein